MLGTSFYVSKDSVVASVVSILEHFPQDSDVSITITRRQGLVPGLSVEYSAQIATEWKEKYSTELTEPKESLPPLNGSESSLSTGMYTLKTKPIYSILHMEQ